VLRALEDEGWMKVLFPAWTTAKADEEKLKALHDLAVELLMQGVHPDMSAAQMQLLTAKLPPKDLAALKKLMLRQGFVEEWNSLDALASGFSKELLAKANAVASAGFRLFTSYDPEAVLWLGFTSKSQAVQERYHLFLKVWPEARQRIPYTLMQEMRITPDLPGYSDLVQAIFLELIDCKLSTPEEMRTYLEPHSPPAPPPQQSYKKTRARRSAESKLKERDYDEDEESEEGLGGDEDLDDLGGEEEDLEADLGLPKGDLEEEHGEESGEIEEEEEEPAPVPVTSKKSPAKAAKQSAEKPVPKPAPAGAQTKTKPAPEPKPKHVPVKETAVAKKTAPAVTKASKPAGKIHSKPTAKPAVKASVKAHAKPAAKPAAAKSKPGHGASAKSSKASHNAKAPKKKPAGKPAKRR
ncbi:MAG TPA: hypothetical protein V6C72_08285, partial [Chroococcales cyanobacterium]